MLKILDDLNTGLPKGSSDMINTKGQHNPISTIYELLKSPLDFGKYLRLAKSKSRADITLSRVAALVGRCSPPEILSSQGIRD